MIRFLLCFVCLMMVGIPSATATSTNNNNTEQHRGIADTRPVDLPVRGSVEKESRKLPPITGEMMEEAFKVSDECSAFNYTAQYYDCDCMGLMFLQLRREKGDTADAFWLKEAAKKKCPNLPNIAGVTYSRCLGWAPRAFGENYKAFCACYGNAYARIHSQSPSENQLVIEANMTKAMASCDANRPNREAEDLRNMINKIKRAGQYDQLFPGASTQQVTPNPYPLNPQ